ncbi:IS200/IS605 family transposase [Levilactobacillus spicheri]|uniref:IS200/IS605 family transposase n=2 Tax=Levilactobacillus spicheri TaxID=216463 RepID=A0ABQ0WPC8_9LACO|nr:IS200/IS605 family transposase [Levilactobacillus spicheri]KRL48584.1 transposase-like protein [Levilactobacillus spicheri DSM 15429]GEO66932.1 IS200/IS605 family transposase [Levilactobacillus spicheri]
MSKEKPCLDGTIYERNYVYNFHFHLIWVTKYRHPVFTTPALTDDMQNILERIAMLNEVTIEQIEIMPDHIHLLISFKPKYAPTNIVKAFKGGSARMFFEKHPEIKAQEFWGGHLWSHSYYMSTLGNMCRETVQNYIANQKRHDSQ